MKKILFLFGILFSTSIGFAQVSQQQAIEIVMSSIVGNDSTNVNVYMEHLQQKQTPHTTGPQSKTSLCIQESSLIPKLQTILWNHRERLDGFKF